MMLSLIFLFAGDCQGLGAGVTGGRRSVTWDTALETNSGIVCTALRDYSTQPPKSILDYDLWCTSTRNHICAGLTVRLLLEFARNKVISDMVGYL